MRHFISENGCVFIMLILQKEESKKTYVFMLNSSIVLCYLSSITHSRLLGSQPLRHSQSLDCESL